MAEHTTTYEDWLTGRGLRPYTIYKRMSFHRTRLGDWGHMDQSPTVIARWLGQYDGWTRCTYHAHLNSIFDWMVETGQVQVNPVRVTIRRPPTPRHRPTPLTEGDLSRVLAVAAPRTRAFLMLGYLAGLRASEIAAFRGEDIDELYLHVVGKGGRSETIPTHPLLWDLAADFPRTEVWFPSPRRSGRSVVPSVVTRDVGTLFRSLDITGATHRARHTYGTQLLRNGANLRVVQELMRHRSLATTAAYLGVDELERRTAIDSLAA